MTYSLGISNFLEGISSLSHSVFVLFFHLFIYIDHCGRLSYLSLLFFRTLHSHVYIFPFLLCLLFLFYSQLFVRPPQTTILPFCITFPFVMVLIPASCSVSRTSLHSSSGTLSVKPDLLNMFLISTV